MTAYLLSLDDLDPNQLNKFNETATFIAAENGDILVLDMLFQDERTKRDQSDKFGDNVMHFAARAG